MPNNTAIITYENKYVIKEHFMADIIPFVVQNNQFRDNFREMKQTAQLKPVYVTDGNKGRYIFCSEEVFQQQLDHYVDELRYEYELDEAISEGLKEYAQGNLKPMSANEIMGEIRSGQVKVDG